MLGGALGVLIRGGRGEFLNNMLKKGHAEQKLKGVQG